MEFVLKIIVLLLSGVGIILVPLGLPGAWLIFSSAVLYSLFYNFNPGKTDFWTLLILFLIAAFGELLELLVSVWGGKKLHVSNGALIASIVGGLVGAVIGVPVFLIGSLLGLLLGVFLGALIYEFLVEKDFAKALKAALAVFFSRLVASFMKTSLALGMFIYLCFRLF